MRGCLQVVRPFVLGRVPLPRRTLSARGRAPGETEEWGRKGRLTCSSRIAPGSTVTSATAIAVETLKVVESTTLTEPPSSCVAFICDILNTKGFGICPCGSLTAVSSVGAAARRALGVLAVSRAEVCHDRWRTGREYVELFGGNVVKRAHARLEVLGENFLRDVRQPLCELRYST